MEAGLLRADHVSNPGRPWGQPSSPIGASAVTEAGVQGNAWKIEVLVAFSGGSGCRRALSRARQPRRGLELSSLQAHAALAALHLAVAAPAQGRVGTAVAGAAQRG